MKDLRSSHASSVRSAIFRYFRLQSTSSRRKNSLEVLQWKKSKEVADGYKKLFDDDTAIENIVAIAFPSSGKASEEVYSDIYIYTTSICDIVLNPDYPSLEVSKRALELRFKRFKVFSEFAIKFIKFNSIYLKLIESAREKE